MPSPTASSPATIKADALLAFSTAAAAVCLVMQFALPSPVDTVQTAAERRSSGPPFAAAPKSLALSPIIAARGMFTGAGPDDQLVAPQVGPVLLGVAQSSGRDSAVVRDSAGVSQALKLGDTLGPWRLASVSETGATFGGPTGPLTLRLGDAASANANNLPSISSRSPPSGRP